MFATEVLTAMLEALRTTVDSNGTAQITLYAGAKPPVGGTPPGAAQAVGVLASPCGVVTGSTLALTAPIELVRTGTENLTWGRVTKGDGTFVMDLTVGTSDAHIILDSLSGSIGGSVTISSATLAYG